MPYGGPPGWYPPPGQPFHHHPLGQYYPPQPPIGSIAQPQATHGPPGPPTPTALRAASAAPVGSNEQKPSPEQQAQELKLSEGKKPEQTQPEQKAHEQRAPEQTAPEQIAPEQIAPEKPIATVKLPSASTTPGPPSVAQSSPPSPPTETKPNLAAALAPPVPAAIKTGSPVAKPVPTGPKNGRIMPVIPRLSPATKPYVPVSGTLPSASGNLDSGTTKDIAKPEGTRASEIATKEPFEDASRDAKAAVAAAMAKLPPAPGQKKGNEVNAVSAVENLTNKVNEMRTSNVNGTSRQRGTSGYAASHRGGRGGYRGGRHQTDHIKRVEVPTTDFDFASANAKFNKQDLVKEAIATGSSIGSPVDLANPNDASVGLLNGARKGSEPSVIISPIASYNKTSFFDNISSESKDRDDAAGKKLGGREFRSEEQKKNLETFGQGSVDNGYRGSFRGRGRGRGYGRPRGGYGRGGRGTRGFHGAAAVTGESW